MSTVLPQYEFEGYRLDPHTQSLLSPGSAERKALKPKEFEVLLYFVKHAGELIAKETLLAALWPGQVVEENNLNQYVTALRKLLGEERDCRRFIMNVRARGYRFVPQVQQIMPEAAQTIAERKLPPTDNLIAWQCYQQAMHLQHSDNIDRWSDAVTLLERACKLDAGFASAFAQLALSRIRLFMLDHPQAMEAIGKAREEASLAVKLRPDAIESHMALGSINAAQGAWVEAELNFMAARELDREFLMPSAMHNLLVILSAGHMQRALELGRQMMNDLKGLAILAVMQTALCVMAGRNEECEEVLELALAMGGDPNFPPLSDTRSMLAQRKGHFIEAGAILISSLAAYPYLAKKGLAPVINRVFQALTNPELKQDAVARLNECCRSLDLALVPHAFIRQILLWYVELGALDEAFRLVYSVLENYQKSGIVGLGQGNLWLPEMAPFRRDSRFSAYVQRLKLPDYWNAFGSPDGHQWLDGRLLVI